MWSTNMENRSGNNKAHYKYEKSLMAQKTCEIMLTKTHSMPLTAYDGQKLEKGRAKISHKNVCIKRKLRHTLCQIGRT